MPFDGTGSGNAAYMVLLLAQERFQWIVDAGPLRAGFCLLSLLRAGWRYGQRGLEAKPLLLQAATEVFGPDVKSPLTVDCEVAADVERILARALELAITPEARTYDDAARRERVREQKRKWGLETTRRYRGTRALKVLDMLCDILKDGRYWGSRHVVEPVRRY